ncbi:MAG: hypothetical protein CL928_06210, partial [Deltaproteobacteria bacterium]|nr:hypothetical protein [Deltaproteobacteria bacterium]
MSLTTSARTLALLASIALPITGCSLESTPQDPDTGAGDATVSSNDERPEGALDQPKDNVGEPSDSPGDNTGAPDGSETDEDNDSGAGPDSSSDTDDEGDSSNEGAPDDTDTGDDATGSDASDDDATTGDGGVACADDAFAGNDTETTAWTLTNGNYNHLVVCDGLPDFYAVDLVENTTVSINLTFAHTEGDIDLALLDPNSIPIASSVSTSDNESVGPINVANSGTYLIQVTLYADDGSTPGNNYDLEVQVGPGTESLGDDDDASDVADDDDSNIADDDDSNIADDDDSDVADDDDSDVADDDDDDGTNVSTSCNPDEYRIDLLDSYGDGWGPNSLSAYDSSGDLLGIYSLVSGYADSVCIFTPDCLELVYDDSGFWNGENSYEVFDTTGTSIAFQAGGGNSYFDPGPDDFSNCTSDSTGDDSATSDDDSATSDDDSATSDDDSAT